MESQITVAVIGALAIALAVAIQIIRVLRRRLESLKQSWQELDSKKRSQSTRYGQISEQFAPFMSNWPWDAKHFKFIGDPIDGVQFTDQGVVFVEIKSASSQLSAVQRQVRDHIKAGRVAWHEHRIDVQ